MRLGRRPLALALALPTLIAAPAPLARAEDEPAAEANRTDEKAASEPTDLAELLRPIKKKHGIPAMGAVIVAGGNITALGVVGKRAEGSDEQVTADDLWHLGSCTKSMTATLIARLVENGDLSWDLTLAKAFPKFARKMDEGYRDVTLELLLGNRGGAPHQLDNELKVELYKMRGTHRDQRRTLFEYVTSRPPVNEPGTTNLYSNAGFAIAGHIAETKLDAQWEDLMQEHVFEPLGITTAGFGAPGTEEDVDQPRGHRNTGGIKFPVPPGPFADNPPGMGPAGTVHMTLGDWAKYVAAHVAGARGESEFLEAEAFAKLHTALEGQKYALGWLADTRPWAGGRVLTHNGSNTMWFCVTWLAPDRDFAVLVTCNVGGAAAGCDEAINALIRHHLDSD